MQQPFDCGNDPAPDDLRGWLLRVVELLTTDYQPDGSLDLQIPTSMLYRVQWMLDRGLPPCVKLDHVRHLRIELCSAASFVFHPSGQVTLLQGVPHEEVEEIVDRVLEQQAIDALGRPAGRVRP